MKKEIIFTDIQLDEVVLSSDTIRKAASLPVDKPKSKKPVAAAQSATQPQSDSAAEPEPIKAANYSLILNKTNIRDAFESIAKLLAGSYDTSNLEPNLKRNIYGRIIDAVGRPGDSWAWSEAYDVLFGGGYGDPPPREYVEIFIKLNNDQPPESTSEIEVVIVDIYSILKDANLSKQQYKEISTLLNLVFEEIADNYRDTRSQPPPERKNISMDIDRIMNRIIGKFKQLVAGSDDLYRYSESKDITPIHIDFTKPKQLNESFLRMFGTAIEMIIGRMFGQDVQLPYLTVSGTPYQMQAFTDTLAKEKRYVDSYIKYGLNDPRTYQDKYKLDNAINNFEKETGIKWPIK